MEVFSNSKNYLYAFMESLNLEASLRQIYVTLT